MKKGAVQPAPSPTPPDDEESASPTYNTELSKILASAGNERVLVPKPGLRAGASSRLYYNRSLGGDIQHRHSLFVVAAFNAWELEGEWPHDANPTAPANGLQMRQVTDVSPETSGDWWFTDIVV